MAKLIQSADQRFLNAISALAYSNPFLPERLELERLALGDDFVEEPSGVWNKATAMSVQRSNVVALTARVELLAEKLRSRLLDGADVSPEQIEQYQDLIQYLVYYRYRSKMDLLVATPAQSTKSLKWWPEFQADFEHFLNLPGLHFATHHSSAHLLACLFQIRRAFHHIFDFVVGSSAPAFRLRAAIWQSIFTHNMRRYQRSLFDKMVDIPTMITGPSGTGKELVARAIGLSRYVPFDPDAKRFRQAYTDTFLPIHLASMTEGLVESELFGHVKGSFTGATADRAGRLELCDSCGTVFLDEIGEVSGAMQVKLLRVLQSREFFRVGESEPRQFTGKVVTATNRDLVAETRTGAFREDLYYRLCADTIVTPSLREQLDDAPEDLENLICFISHRVAGDEAESVASDVVAWVGAHCGQDYAWNGNIRELEQCVRNIMVHGAFQPAPAPQAASSAADVLIQQINTRSLTAEELLQRYCDLVYSHTGSYEQTARLLKLDRRTVKSRIEAFRDQYHSGMPVGQLRTS